MSLEFDNYINSVGYFEKAKRREDKTLKYLIDVGYTISQPIIIYFDDCFRVDLLVDAILEEYDRVTNDIYIKYTSSVF